jgi:transposase
LPAFVAVGIDSADAHHEIHAEAAGAAPVLRLRISNDLAGFQRLLDALREAFGELPCRFALENPSLLIARFLLHAGSAVYAVNPRSVAKMREALASSGKKDDPLDAESLCILLRRRAEDLAPVRLGSSEGLMLAGLVRQRVDVVEEKNRLLNQLTAVLKGYYPRALELFPNLEQPLTLAFLQAFDAPTALAAATEEQWRGLFAGQRYPRPSRITPLLEQARQPQVAVSPVDEALGARQVRRLVRTLQVLLDELRSLEAEIEARFDQLPDAAIFRSLPGAAAVLAPALFAVLGDDRERWEDWREIALLSGAVPVTRSSGRFRTVGMRYHCDHRARRTLHLFAACSRRSCAWARDFYAEQRRRGKSHGTALRNLASKWLRILYRLWQDRVLYDEKKYLQRRSQRQAPRSLTGTAPA